VQAGESGDHVTGEEKRPRVVVRKRRGFGMHNRVGVWKLAYADFSIAMMAFFMVLWLMTQADLKLRSQIAMYFRNPGVLPGGAAINEQPNAARSRLPKVVSDDIVVVHGDREEQAFRKRAKEIARAVEAAAAEMPAVAEVAGQAQVRVGPEGLTFEIVDQAGTLLFDVASAELKPQVVEVLRRIAPVLAKLPNPLQVGGHTDARPFPAGSPQSNWQLAFARADAARRVLEGAGLRPGHIERVLSFADTQPLVPGDPLAPENRRLSILAVRREVPSKPVAEGPITRELRAREAAGVPKSAPRR
jgi:chemotaxis protein MotB